MTNDATLSRETYLIYQYISGFEPERGNLTRWIGYLKDNNGIQKQALVIIPNKFPAYPPQIYLPKNTIHPAVNSDGSINLRTVSRWRPNIHVYQVIREAVNVIRRSSFENGRNHEPMHVANDVYRRQISHLESQLRMKKKELLNLETTPLITKQNTEQALSDILENQLIDIDNDLYALEEQYDSFEIDSMEFAKEFIKLRKKYLLFEKSRN